MSVERSTASSEAAASDALRRLQDALRPLRRVIVAFSGGIDSSLVARVAVDVLGRENVLAVTARSPAVPAEELAGVAALAFEVGAPHEFIDTAEFQDENYLANPANRCYFCKTELYGRLAPLAEERGFSSVVNGVNADDLGDYRPGLQAADEHGVRSPLAVCGIDKATLRAIARLLGLSIADKPAGPCLSSRVEYGEPITADKLRRIDAAETFLRKLGFRECRVRHHGDLARIEVPADEITRLAGDGLRVAISARLRELGYRYVTLDLQGFRSGSMNEVLLGGGLRERLAPTSGVGRDGG